MSLKKIIDQYLQRLYEVTSAGDAREESYYSSLAELLSQAATETARDHVHVTTLPKKTEAGNPDFRVWDGASRIIGYLEAKKPDAENLDYISDSEQLRRYRETFPNLILTNFLEFRLYRNGEWVDTVLLGRPAILNRVGMAPPAEKPEQLLALLERFFDFSLPSAVTAPELAVQLAKRTRFLRDVTADLLIAEQAAGSGNLTGFFEAFQQFLIGDLTKEDFSDLYAQTITYGLFAARTRAKNGFSRRDAFDNIPHTIGVLRDLFRFISLGDPPAQLQWIVDDIAEVLAQAEAKGILDRYYHEGKGSDPIVHFYETFLAKYDPEERERRGVYYTPEPVVSYIVRSVHELLKTEFKLADGLASQGVTLLDPAAGTMTFIARAAELAVHEFEQKYGAGKRGDFIRDHVLKNFHAFELMMAPYAVGHLKMSFFLEELGHRLADNERVNFFLTNSLDMEELETSRLPGFSSLAEESRLAGKIKREKPILVILGNPPYSGESSNKGPWISGLIDDYKLLDGKPLQEKTLKWLQDDYVKFLRFAQWKIDQAGLGIVAMITNHSYLDNPTFRGMRQSLMQSFDDIYILDLHGNSLKKETCPDGSPDQNVFDIRQGVAIAIFIKGSGGKKKAGIHHAEVWGKREAKHEWLEKHDAAKTKWSKLKPRSEAYFFIPRNYTREKGYNAFVPVPKIFPVNSVGIVSARDGLTIQWTPDEVWKTVTVFSRMDPELAREAYQLGKDVRDWKVEFAQKDLMDSGPTREKIYPILYRPFDVRYTYYTGHSRGFLCMPRPEVMKHMLKENLALIVPRRVEHVGTWQHAFVCQGLSEHVAVSLKTIDYHFPLYLYNNHGPQDLLSSQEPSGPSPNINPGLLESLGRAFGRAPSPEQVFHYVYAVLNATPYRREYGEFLRMDFPRIVFTNNKKIFAQTAGLGQRLAALHLLRSRELDPPLAKFKGEGDGKVRKGKKGWRFEPAGSEQYIDNDGRGKPSREKRVQHAAGGRVYINEAQYFGPVDEAVWEYRIGGYQVCCKWLKDRAERRLDLEEIKTYCRIVTAIRITIAIQLELNGIYPKIENSPLPIGL